MQSNNSNSLAGATRRDFLKTTTTAAVAVAATGLVKPTAYGQAPAPGRVIGANDRINVAFIGVGGQGMAHVRSIKEFAGENNVALVALADVSQTRGAEAKEYIGGDVKVFDDYKKLLEDKDIDAVVVATHDVWHAQCTMDSMEAGKHVYCEKPMTRYLDEAFRVYDVCKKTKRTFQVGAQICSDARWHLAAKLVKEGKIGKLVLGQDSYMRNNRKGEWNYTIQKWASPEDIDWKYWMGPNIKNKTDFNADSYFRWRKYYPYCAGLLGDLMPHRLHPYMIATGNPEFPARVTCLGAKNILSDKETPGTPIRDVPETIALTAEFPSGLILLMTCSTVNEQGLPSMLRGNMATLYFGGSGDTVELKVERPYSEEIDPERFNGLKPSGEKIPEQEKNWFECIRTPGKVPYGNIDLAIRVQTVISLAEMSERLNLVCRFDEKARKVMTADGKEIDPITYGTLPLS